MPIAQKHQDQLIKQGYAVVPNFLTPEELTAAKQNFSRYFPGFDELQATPERFGFIHEDPEHLQTEFPFAGDDLNDVSTHPDIISFVERLLGTEDILLSQAAIWAKYAGTGDFDQGLHLDYQGNTLVVPRDDGDYRQVNFILYYSDVTAEVGPTYVISQEHTRDLPLWPTHRTRKKNPDLYQLERPVLANAGDLLIFGMRTWHRDRGR
jgi:ectoine hydroxylase-related dioxygenase (phytanoyl-CoA dioxygenase family)